MGNDNMAISKTTGYTEIVKITEAALKGDADKARRYVERFIIKYPESDLIYPFTHLLKGENNPSGLGHGDITNEKQNQVLQQPLVSGSFPTDAEMLDFLQQIMTNDNDYCEIYLSGLRGLKTGTASAFQFETNPEKIPTLNKPTLREAIAEAMKVARQ